jgi:hypothetical protein
MALISDDIVSPALADQAGRAVAARDLRLDFFRGLALYMIFIDHVIGDPFAHFTYQAIGFSDAAEMFVYLSGLGCGIAYSRTLARWGWPGMLWTAFRRAARIYAFYLASGAIVIGLAAMNAGIWDQPQFEQTLGFAANDPMTSFWLLLTMRSSPADSGILVLYICLTIIAVPLFLAGSRRHPRATLVASGCLWLISRPLHDVSAFLIGGWYLNPFAWQFLFSIGMYFGVAWDSPEQSRTTPQWRRWLLPLASAIVAGAFLYKLAIFLLPHLAIDSSWLRFSKPALADMKRHLSSLRLVHFLCVVYVVTAGLRRDNPIMCWAIAKPLILSGQHSLEIFSMTVVLDMIVNIAVLSLRPPIAERLLFDGFALAVITIIAFALARSAATADASVPHRLKARRN